MKNNIFKILIVGFLLITAGLAVIAGDAIVKQGDLTINKLTTTGSVGIGTTTPGAKLDVNGGNIRVSDGTTRLLDLSRTVGTGGFVYQSFRLGDVEKWWLVSDGTNNQLEFRADPNGTPKTLLYLTQAGNVGIGTARPAANLDLGNSVTNKKLFIQTDGSTYAHGFGIANSELRIFTAAGGTNHISFGHYNLGTNVFTERMRMDVNGKIGIGTVTPQATLHVKGSVKIEGASFVGGKLVCVKSDTTLGTCIVSEVKTFGTCTCV